MRYKQIYDGEWFKPRMKKHFMRCCGCQLTHIMNFKVVNSGRGKAVLIQAFRQKKKKKK